MCLVAFQKIFRKIFSIVRKIRRKRQNPEKHGQNPEEHGAIDGVRSTIRVDCDLAKCRSTLRDWRGASDRQHAKHRSRWSRSCEASIDALRDRDRRDASWDRDLGSPSTARSREAPFASIAISWSVDRRGASRSMARSVLHDWRRVCELSRSPLRVPNSRNHLKWK